ncbi:magnesium transporter [Aliifodinibius sp. S!AR15-10]|uniref:magnesium transporter n=1 Tax=Aliifodinibius sp. S!AR15-10 TaxID=2950437 RepID=UPI002857972F|nr:magnesium transporter [Aliifodinibius sp. S!AR15-10]MDR8394036.1 magnesium transporter [Aliifodinibius sp. S!AR15-10]
MIVDLLKPEFDELIKNKDWVALKDILNDVPAVDVAELLEGLEAQVAIVIFRLLKKQKAADVFTYLSSQKGVELLEVFTAQQLSDVMSNLEPDERVALMEELPGHLTQRVINSMHTEDRKLVQKLLGYPEESVGRLMTPRYVKVRKDWTIAKSMEQIRKFGHSAETVNVIYVVDEHEHLIDDLRLNQLILADPEAKIESLMDESFEALSAFEDQEDAVKMLSKYDRVAMPVVDSDGILVGIVTVDDVIDVAEEETTEDMQLMAGMDALDDYYSQTSIFEMVRKRIGWLIILFVGQMLTATAMGAYENVIAGAVFLSLFIPMIISSGGNSGSQAATLIIRALSTDDINMEDWKKIFRRELLSGLFLGLLLGFLGFFVILSYGYAGGSPMNTELILSALVVSLSLVGVVLFGNLSGSMLPFVLSKMGLDPAVTSAPFVSTLVDVTGIVIYFSIAVALLKGVTF